MTDDTVMTRLTRLPPTWEPPSFDRHAATWTAMECGTTIIDYRPRHSTLCRIHASTPTTLRIGTTRTGVPYWGPTLGQRADTDSTGPNRAHDRPPSRTTKTATLYTNPATSWQIDVREYVNTLIVVDLSKPQID